MADPRGGRNIVSGRDLDDGMGKRAVYEAEMSKTNKVANASKEPATFRSATTLATQVTGGSPQDRENTVMTGLFVSSRGEWRT